MTTYRDHESEVLEVAAEDLELGSGCRQDRLFDGLHQHVQYPGYRIKQNIFALNI